MKQEIQKAYRDLHLEPQEPRSLEELKEITSQVKTSWRKLVQDYHPDSGRKIKSSEITKRINLAKEVLENYFVELKEILPEKSQEIHQEKHSQAKTVYPQNDNATKEWQPKDFEKEKARQKYQENSEGFKSGMFNKVA